MKKNSIVFIRKSVIKTKFYLECYFYFKQYPKLFNTPFKQWQKDIFKAGKKTPRIKYKLLHGAKERERLGLPDLKLHFAAGCLVWMKRVDDFEK